MENDNKQLASNDIITKTTVTEVLASPVCSIPDAAYDVRQHPDWPGFFIYKLQVEVNKHKL